MYRDELKKIDEQTGGLKAKESSRKQSYEEKQIQVYICSCSSKLLKMKCPDTEREGGAVERAVEERASSKTG